MIEEKITAPQAQQGDADETLRPSRFDDYIGQKKVKDNIRVFVEAAKLRGQVMDHALLYGPPGLGKTTLAHIMASELGQSIKVIAAPALEKQGDLMALITSLEEGDVLFIDEIHRMKRVLEETLYSAMEDFKVDIIIGEGTGARTLSITLPHFTLIGATTRVGAVSAPLRSRFGIIERLDFYEPADLDLIIKRSSHILKISIDPAGSSEVARRSRGTPRIANRLLKRVADFALVDGQSTIDKAFAHHALSRLEVDEMGLDIMDRRLLRIIIDHYQGGPVGISAIAAALSEESETIEDVYEPFLIQKGLLQRQPRGRVASALAYRHLGVEWTDLSSQQPGLF